MNKDEINSRMTFLNKAISSKGRTYSAAQRTEMKEELKNLKIDLDKINLIESIEFIKEFQKNNPSKFKIERKCFKIDLDNLLKIDDDRNLLFLMENKTEFLFKDLNSIEHSIKEIESFEEALSYFEKGEKIPSSNHYSYYELSRIQSSLSAHLKSLSFRVSNLSKSISELKLIKDFLLSDNQLKGFVFLSDAVFSEVSDFIEGYGKVSTQSKSLFFSYDSKCYKNDTLIEDIPKINTIRSNPDLIPFEMLDKYGDFDIFDGLMGYKNQNGEVIIPAKYKSAYPFVNGFAKVVISKKIISHTYFKFGLIDSEGNFVLPCDFTEIGDVYNDVVWYKKSIIKSDYVDVSGAACNYNMQEVSTKYIRYGYLIYKELRPAIYNEIEEIFKTEADIKNLKTNGEVDNAYETIRETKKKIDLYLQTVLSAYTK